VAGDLLVLGYFKYAGFLAANLNALVSTQLTVNILLPVGISFYSITQIAFLVDAYRGEVARYRLPYYALFVTYFPHLIAGPILHHKDVIPQFEQEQSKRPDPHLVRYGLMIFSIGLFKKTCMADAIQPFVALAFGPTPPSFDQAWIGALAYTFRLYFDFSGYSDMAIGISLMFGIFLPLNFNSLYKAKKHHRFLAPLAYDVVAISPRLSLYPAWRQPARHRAALCQPDDHHGAWWPLARSGLDFRRVGRPARGVSLRQSRLEQIRAAHPAAAGGPANIAAFALTFLSVAVAWVFFRADSVTSAIAIVSRMARPDLFVYDDRERLAAAYVIIFGLIAFFAPNTQQLLGYDHASRKVGISFADNVTSSGLFYTAACLLAFGILGIQKHSEFIYFRF